TATSEATVRPPTPTRVAIINTVTPTAVAPASMATFTIGATSQKVEYIQGTPSARYPSFWTYGLATVELENGRVVGWSNIGNELQVSLQGAGTKPGGSFTVNSSRADVASVQGVPTGHHRNYWNYGLATVEFDGDHVSGWTSIGGMLRVE